METIGLPITFDRIALSELCATYGVRRLSLFGSVLRSDFRPDSDVDVLVEFHTGVHIGWDIVNLADALSELAGRTVDLHTPMELSRHFRREVLASAQVVYESAG